MHCKDYLYQQKELRDVLDLLISPLQEQQLPSTEDIVLYLRIALRVRRKLQQRKAKDNE